MNNYEQTTQGVIDAFKALCKGRVEDAVRAEREACAKVCDEIATEDGWEGGYAYRCVEAIRARSNT